MGGRGSGGARPHIGLHVTRPVAERMLAEAGIRLSRVEELPEIQRRWLANIDSRKPGKRPSVWVMHRENPWIYVASAADLEGVWATILGRWTELGFPGRPPGQRIFNEFCHPFKRAWRLSPEGREFSIRQGLDVDMVLRVVGPDIPGVPRQAT